MTKSDEQEVTRRRACFALPNDMNPALPPEFSDFGDEILAGQSSRNADGLSRIVPTMICGEESATHVFDGEAKRLSEKLTDASNRLMADIAGEEAQHAIMLDLLRSRLPEPGDMDAIRRRAKYFFIRVASRDIAVHFSRISGLDSGVCLTLSAMLHSSAALAKSPVAHRLWSRIWRDEARHVRASRSHVLEMGLSLKELNDEARQVRKTYADLLVTPLGDDFENIGVDADRLYKRIVGPEEVYAAA